jgi:hypothetical protein
MNTGNGGGMANNANANKTGNGNSMGGNMNNGNMTSNKGNKNM